MFNLLAPAAILSIAILTYPAFSQSTGPNSPQSAYGWTNPQNVYTSNNSYATAGVVFSQSGSLVATGFGFSIPSTEMIDGIVVQIERSRSSLFNHVVDNSVRLTKDGTTEVGADKANTEDNWPTGDGYASYGGSTDLWETSWDVSDINSANFGVVISIQGLAGTGRIDHIRIIVHHHTAFVPITLSSFDAIVTDANTVKLNWTTASEINNDFFTIEKSRDGESFTAAADMKGSGNTTTPRHYSYEDRQPVAGRSYYRLKQTDFGGTFTYSKAVMIDYEGPKNPVLTILSNAQRDNSVHFRIVGMPNVRSIRMALFDRHGRILAKQQYDISHPGVIEGKLKLASPLSAGLYILKGGPGLQMTRKLVVR